MFTFYVVCAGIGCALMLVQFLLTLIGLAGDHDFGVEANVGDVHMGAGAGDVHIASGAGDVHFEMDHVDHDGGHHGSSWFFGVLSFRSMVAAVAFFGLAGAGGLSSQLNAYASFVTALAAGCAAMVVVAWLMRSLHRLSSAGNVHIENAVGVSGTVYLTIPPKKSGAGKVTVRLQNRTMEYQAMTDEGELSTGTPIVVVGIVGNDILEVAPATNEEN